MEEPKEVKQNKEGPKIRIKSKSKERRSEKKKREVSRRIPPHSLEARYEEPKVTLSIKEQGESELQSESEGSAKLQ